MSAAVPDPVPDPAPDAVRARLVARHLQIGWWGLLIFLLMGAGLEVLHGLKVGGYLDVSNQARRLLWTLAHAHGALIALVHLGFAASLAAAPAYAMAHSAWASHSLSGALVLIPAGFFLAGAYLHHGEPGLGIYLLLPGVAVLFAGVAFVASGLGRASRG